MCRFKTTKLNLASVVKLGLCCQAFTGSDIKLGMVEGKVSLSNHNRTRLSRFKSKRGELTGADGLALPLLIDVAARPTAGREGSLEAEVPDVVLLLEVGYLLLPLTLVEVGLHECDLHVRHVGVERFPLHLTHEHTLLNAYLCSRQPLSKY